MSEIVIRKVSTRSELKVFVDFPFQLYKGNAFWVPPLKFDEINTLRKDKNPAFSYCESEYWLAFNNNRPVGRIAGIINHKESDQLNTRLVGQTMREGRTLAPPACNVRRNASIWTVLPRPISSARMPPEPLLRRKWNQATPVFW